ncbi:MAG TPA: queuosine precursor transporter [Pseudoxanthomonas sp.]|jgi:uncharacterized PurR-regulated membrane protein YhhQ (DUF165 family)|nr:queuosine precursor transporter [Pseudoxanthomonas sp.]
MPRAPVRRHAVAATVLMAAIVLASNYLVQFPINAWLTWGAFSYPLSYLVTDVVNRLVGPGLARRVVVVGFVLAVLCSIWLATPRIALASGAAFLFSQLTDIEVFNRLRRQRWWVAPLSSNTLAACLDTLLFWGIAFVGVSEHWLSWAVGDLMVKLAMAILVILPFRLLTRRKAAVPLEWRS